MLFDLSKFATRFMGASFKFPVRQRPKPFLRHIVREIEHRLYDKREVFVMSRIIKVEVGVIRGRPFNS